MSFANPTTILAIFLAFVMSASHVAAFPSQFSVRQDEKYSYDPGASNGPSNWANLDPTFAECAGGSQSPIDFPCLGDPAVSTLPIQDGPSVTTASSTYTFSVSPFNWALNCDSVGSCGSATYQGKTYNVINIHFHSNSEHTINGRQYLLELHIVHQASDGTFLVIAVMFGTVGPGDCLTAMPARGGFNSAFESILNNVEQGVTQFTVNTGDFLDVGALISSSLSFCTYSGSLTTPPCTETVQWFLAGQRQTIAIPQVFRYRQTASATQFGNNRPIQPLNSRQVICFVQWKSLSRKETKSIWLDDDFDFLVKSLLYSRRGF